MHINHKYNSCFHLPGRNSRYAEHSANETVGVEGATGHRHLCEGFYSSHVSYIIYICFHLKIIGAGPVFEHLHLSYFYLQDLSSVVCTSVKELEYVLSLGNRNRLFRYFTLPSNFVIFQTAWEGGRFSP